MPLMPKQPTKRNIKPLTQREVQCRKVARDKALRKFWHGWWCRLRLGLAAVAAVLFLAAGIWQWQAQGITRTVDSAVQSVYNATGRAGFRLKTITLEGRSRTARAEVEKVLTLAKGTPTLALSLDALRADLERIP